MKHPIIRPAVVRRRAMPLDAPARANRRPGAGMSRWAAVQRQQFERLIAPPPSGAAPVRRVGARDK